MDLRLRAAPARRADLTTSKLDSGVLLDVVRRLRWLAAVLGVTFAMTIVVQGIRVAMGDNLVPMTLPIVGPRILGAVCALIFWVRLSTGMNPRRVMEVAPVFEVILAFCISSFELALRVQLDAPLLGTFLPAHIFAFRAFVPYGLRKAALTTAASVGTLPLCALILDLGGLALAWAQVLTMTALIGLTSIGAIVLSVGLRQMQSEISEAREMGSYELLGELGRGGMGVVYRARHRMLKRDAAIKVIKPPDVGEATDALARFEREAQTTAAMRSPNTIEIYDFGPTEDGAFFYVMELLDGLDLEQLVRRYGPLPPGRAIHLLTQACRSLGEAHDAGLFHRDVKPANLFLCRMGPELDVVKVMDFGLVSDPTALAREQHGDAPESLSKLFNSADQQLTVEGSICGTPGYMAPETIRGDGTNARSDVYAMGCVAYWLLTGKRPFHAPSPWLLFVAHLDHDPPPPTGLDADLTDTVMACLSKDPADRPADGNALAELLQSCAAAGSWSRNAAEAWWRNFVEHPAEGGPAAPTAAEPMPTIADADTIASLDTIQDLRPPSADGPPPSAD